MPLRLFTSTDFWIFYKVVNLVQRINLSEREISIVIFPMKFEPYLAKMLDVTRVIIKIFVSTMKKHNCLKRLSLRNCVSLFFKIWYYKFPGLDSWQACHYWDNICQICYSIWIQFIMTYMCITFHHNEAAQPV